MTLNPPTAPTLSTAQVPSSALEFGSVATPAVAAALEAVYQRDIGVGFGEIVGGQTIQTPEQLARYQSALAERRSLA